MYNSLQNISKAQLNQIAQEMFTNMNEEDFSGFGEDDGTLNFGSDDIDSFLGEGAVNRQFQVLIDNNNTSNVLKLVLFGGALSYKLREIEIPVYGALASGAYPVTGKTKIQAMVAPNGLMLDGYFQDTTAISTSSADGLVASSLNSKTIYELSEYLRFNPSRLLKMKVTSDNPNQIQIPLTVKRVDPYKVAGEKYIYPANSQDQYVNQDKISVFDANIVLDANHTLEYAIAPSAQATLTFFFGASKDLGKGLQKQGQVAQVKKAMLGVRPAGRTAAGLPVYNPARR